MNARPNIVLIHGAWAEGSCWSDVIERLQADGYHVTAPQFPLTALADDVARLRQVLNLQDGPAVVAGHSYGGQIMTALGADAPNVAGLVYIAAFGLDQGESLGGLLSQGPVTPALAHLFTDKQGFGWLSEDDFVHHFAADVDPVRARVMYAVQQPLAMSAFGDVMGVPAWKTRPSWYLVATDDQALPPAAERQFAARMGATTVEIPSSHVAMVSHPGDGIAADLGAQGSDVLVGDGVPVGVELGRGGVQEGEACGVDGPGRAGEDRREQGPGQGVAGQDVQAAVADVGRDAAHRLQHVPQFRAHRLPGRASRGLRRRGGVGGADQVEQVDAFGVVEQQGAGDGVQDGVGGAAGIAALQPGVVRDADPGQQRDLLAAQARDPAGPGERGDLQPGLPP
jgi:pimeloyl-ACP methyl ester carboxylesterase